MDLCCCSCKGWPNPKLMFVLAVLPLAIGIAVICITPSLVTSLTNSQIVLSSPSSSIFATFQDPSAQPYSPKGKLSIYGFHCTNSDDVIKNGVAPRMQQVGPFVYTVNRYKVLSHPAWDSSGEKISYRYHTTYVFDKESSVEDDNSTRYTFINPGIAGALIRLEDPRYSSIIGKFLSWVSAYYQDGLFTSRTIREIVYGYNSPVLNSAKDTHALFPDTTPEVPTTYPAVIINDSFITYSADTTSLTGKSNINDILKVDQWVGYSKLNWWGSEDAQSIGGTDGTQFAPELKLGDRVEVFLDTFGRDVKLKVDEALEAELPIKRLRLCLNSLKSANENSDNIGYYQFGANGVWNLTAVPLAPVYNAPIFTSKPFFLDADPSYREKVIFTELPDPEKHDMKLDIVEHIGVPLRANIRFQVNCKMWKVKGVTFTDNLVGERIVPIIWVDLSVQPTQDTIDYMKSKLNLRKMALISGYLFGSISILLAIISIIVGVISNQKHKKPKRSEDAYKPLNDINGDNPQQNIDLHHI